VSGTIAVTAEVATSAPVAYVLLAVDGTRPASTNSLPARFQLDTYQLPDGPHVLSAEVYAHRTRIAASRPITVYVSNQTAPAPSCASTKPAKVAARSAARLLKPQRAMPTAAAAPMTAPSAAAPSPTLSGNRIAAVAEAKRGPAPEPAVISITARDRAAAEEGDAVAGRSPAVLLDGKTLVADVTPTVVEGQMRSGFRALFAAAGARVDWLAGQRTARCVTDSLVVEVPIGSRIAMVNGQQVDMGAVATIRNGRTVVPLRFFAQVTGSRLSWDAQTRIARVETPSRTMASAQASRTPAAAVQTPVYQSASTGTPIYEAADRAP
jgi:hypothetical protein